MIYLGRKQMKKLNNFSHHHATIFNRDSSILIEHQNKKQSQ